MTHRTTVQTYDRTGTPTGTTQTNHPDAETAERHAWEAAEEAAEALCQAGQANPDDETAEEDGPHTVVVRDSRGVVRAAVTWF